MSQPPAYTPQHSFTSDGATLANFPGQSLDIEFNDIKATTDAIRGNLALIQRDDGALKNASVDWDQLSTAVKASIGDTSSASAILVAAAAAVTSATASAASATTSQGWANTSAGSATASASSATASATSATNAATSATNAAASASAAAASASFLANSLPTYPTRAVAAAATISTGYAAIQIIRHTTGYPPCYATYIPGTSAGPMAFQEAGGHWWELDISGGELLIPWFGAKGDLSVVDTTAVQTAINAAAGKRLNGMGLSYKITVTLIGVSNIEIRNCTLKQAAYPAAHPVIAFVGKEKWAVRNVVFDGDNQGPLSTDPGSTSGFVFTNSTANTLSDMEISGCTFKNFNSNYWVLGSIDGSAPIVGFKFLNNVYTSDGSYVVANHYGIVLFGSQTNTAAAFVGTQIRDNRFNAQKLTIAIAIFNSHFGYRITGNYIEGVGANSTFDPAVGDENSYGILLNYDQTGTSPGLYSEVTGNIIINPPAAGIYMIPGDYAWIHHNIIVGQYHSDALGIPRGGIVVNQTNGNGIACVESNLLISCLVGVSLSAVAGGGINTIRGNVIKYFGAATAPIGIKLQGASIVSGGPVVVELNHISLSGSGSIAIDMGGGSGNFGDIRILRNRIGSCYRGVSGNGVSTLSTILLDGNSYSEAIDNAAILFASLSGRLVIRGETIDLATALGRALNLDGCTGVAVDAIVIMNRNSGIEVITAVGTQGAIDGVRFVNVANTLRIVATSLGTALPSFSGSHGDIVQALGSQSYTQAGSGGSLYVIPKYVCGGGTAWYPWHVLTGN